MDLLPEISQPPRILSDVEAALKTKQFKAEIDDYIKVCFLFLFPLFSCPLQMIVISKPLQWSERNNKIPHKGENCFNHNSSVLFTLTFSIGRDCHSSESVVVESIWHEFLLDQNRNVSDLISMDLKGRLSCSPQEALISGSSYNVPLLNALVLYVGMQVSQQFLFFFPSVIALGFFILMSLSMAFTVVAMIITRAKIWHKLMLLYILSSISHPLMVCFDGSLQDLFFCLHWS